jgi:mono/diheme cytochrome c family protein
MSSETNQPASADPEAKESRIRDVTVPMWLIILMFVILYWGALYFDGHGGWFSSRVYAPFQSLAEVEDFQVTGAPNPLEMGLRVYNKPTCVACHQSGGQGVPGQFPPLAGSEWVNEPEPGRVIRIVLNGLQGPITVKGNEFNNTMVPWNSLSDDDIAAVLTYVRQNKEWGNDAPPVTPERVKAVREKIKNHPGAFTPAELLKISPAD